MKKYRHRSVIIFLLSAFVMAPMADRTHRVEITSVPAESLHNAGETVLADGTRGYTVMDLRYRDNIDPLNTELLLSFDRKAPEYLKDDSGRYEVVSANYRFVKGQGAVGGGCASFYKNDHAVEIKTSSGLWLGSSGDAGSFSLEFRFRPADTGRKGVLFSRTGWFSGMKKGIEISIEDGRVYARCHNMFQDDSGLWKSAVLFRGKRAQKNRWYHFCLSYDRLTGRLVKYINGREEDSAFFTSTGESAEGVMIPSFGHRKSSEEKFSRSDLPVVSIGENYSGLIDEFRISRMSLEELGKRTDVSVKKYAGSRYAGSIPYNREGVVTSPVYSFGSTGTSVTEFLWHEDLSRDTFIWMEFRTSDSLFSSRDSSVKWYRINRGQRNIFLQKTSGGLFLRGKYYQWRAHLVPSPDGENAPVLKKVSIGYRKDLPPVVPMFVEVSGTGDSYVMLRWKKNVDHDINSYKIYYGTRRGRFDGIITTSGGRKIGNTMAKGSYIEIRIDNALINENRKGDSRRVLVYPSIENNVLYFFSVSACDSYRPGTVYNHESELSKPVSARPYGGSEIK